MCDGTETPGREPMQSPTIGKLALALSKVQGALTHPDKNQTVEVKMRSGSKYSFNYSDMPAVIDSAKAALAANELSVTQLINTDMAAGSEAIKTVLLHSSGEYISSTIQYKITKLLDGGKEVYLDAQERGGLQTYMRRYSYMAIVGIAPSDETDSAEVSGVNPPAKPSKPKDKPLPPATNEAFKSAIARMEKCTATKELDRSKEKYLGPIWDKLNKTQQGKAQKVYEDTKAKITAPWKKLVDDANEKIKQLNMDEPDWADLCFTISEVEEKRAPEKLNIKQLETLIDVLGERLAKEEIPF